MSFSIEVKKELCKRKVEGVAVQSLLCGMVLSSGSLVLASSGITFTVSSENSDYIEFFKSITKQFCPSVSFKETIENVNFKQKERIELKIDSLSGRQILSELGIISFSKDGSFEINRLGESYLTHEDEGKISFLKGMFLGSGSISIPEPIDVNDFSKKKKNSGYHMEWNVQSKEQADYIIDLLASFDILCRNVQRNDSYVVYLKESESISMLLGLFGANKSVLTLENERAGREMRNLVNRQANCISANIDKSINTALKQLEAIEVIKQTIGIEGLPENLQEVALARLENPEGSLTEIIEALDKKISKGAVSQRFKKIEQIAKEIG